MLESVIYFLIMLCVLALVIYLAIYVVRDVIGMPIPPKVIQILWVIVMLLAVLWLAQLILGGGGFRLPLFHAYRVDTHTPQELAENDMNRVSVLSILPDLSLVHRDTTGPARGISSGARADRPGAPEPGRLKEGCSAYIPANGIYGPCANGFPQMPGCRRDNPGFWRPCLDEEWCGRRYEKTGGAPPLREGQS